MNGRLVVAIAVTVLLIVIGQFGVALQLGRGGDFGKYRGAPVVPTRVAPDLALRPSGHLADLRGSAVLLAVEPSATTQTAMREARAAQTVPERTRIATVAPASARALAASAPGTVYLIDPAGRLLLRYPDADEAAMAADLRLVAR